MSGTFNVNASDDGIHATTLLQIDGGSFDVTAAEGLEATDIRINDGEINISSSDDGVNAAYKSYAYTPTVEINEGTLTSVMDAGDTDGVDSNGNLIINGGTIDITGQYAFDYDGTEQYTQIVLKTERAVKNLRWISAEVLNAGEIIKYREIVTAEEEAYQKLFSEEVERLQP